jgi:superfamily II DNA or RNA helicase
MSSLTLRPYQIDNVAALDALAPGDRILSVGPTGSGKTIIFCELIKRQVARSKRVLVIAHRREIIAQTSRKLFENGVRHGIIQAGFDPRPMELVQVASIATLYVRAIRSEAMRLPLADLVIVDEAHHSPAHSYSKIIESYPQATIIGFTATPARGDGRGLGAIFKTMIQMPQIAALIEQKYLVRSRVYAPVDPDLRGVRTVAGDYVESQLAERMDTAKLIGDVVTHWHKYGERRRTVAFAVNVAHSIHLCDEFVCSGVRAEHLDGATPIKDREAILARLASEATELVTNCMVLTEGWDMPEVGCCILARPTKKMGLFRQMIGRVLRPADGKPDAIILDHSGAVFKHGLPEDDVKWTLNPGRHAESQSHAARLRHEAAGLIECTQCTALRLGGKPCPACGFLPRRPARDVSTAAGDLALVQAGRAKAPEYDRAMRSRWHGMLAFIARERGYARGWVAHKFREKFGAWPAWGSNPEPIEPTPEVSSWVRSRIIAFAKRQGAGQPDSDRNDVLRQS